MDNENWTTNAKEHSFGSIMQAAPWLCAGHMQPTGRIFCTLLCYTIVNVKYLACYSNAGGSEY